MTTMMTRRANAAPTAMGTILLSGISLLHTKGAEEGMRAWRRGEKQRGGRERRGGQRGQVWRGDKQRGDKGGSREGKNRRGRENRVRHRGREEGRRNGTSRVVKGNRRMEKV